jgi:hypothetical protein
MSGHRDLLYRLGPNQLVLPEGGEGIQPQKRCVLDENKASETHTRSHMYDILNRYVCAPGQLERVHGTQAKWITRQFIGEYNSAVAFLSMGAGIKSPPGNGLYSFCIHGEIYHFASLLYPNDKSRLRYGKLYILDSAKATTEWCRRVIKPRAYDWNNAITGRYAAISWHICCGKTNWKVASFTNLWCG